MALILNINIQTECMLIAVPGRQGKYIFFTQESFCLQGILDDIKELDTSCFDCKYKHMMKSRAPPEKFGVLPRLFPMEFHGFTSRIDFKELPIFGF